MTLIEEGSKEGRQNVLINGKGGEIPYVKSFDTETKEVIMFLYDAENYSILGVDKKPIEVKVIVPLARLVKLQEKGKPTEEIAVSKTDGT